MCKRFDGRAAYRAGFKAGYTFAKQKPGWWGGVGTDYDYWRFRRSEYLDGYCDGKEMADRGVTWEEAEQYVKA